MRLPRILSLPALLLLLAASISAHEFTITEVVVVFPGDGTYQIDMTCDADALALGLPPDTDSEIVAEEMRSLTPEDFEAAVAQARHSLQRFTRIRFDGATKETPEVEFPHYGTPAATEAEIPTVLGTIGRMRGRIPEGAETFTFGASRIFKAVHMTVFEPTSAQPTRYILGVAEDSPAYELGGGEQLQPRGGVFWTYLGLGFEHIIPEGLDHVLFVLGLFLLSTRFRPLLWQVTAFTIAHSITLALAVFDVVSLPERLVESLIGASIAYVAIENLFTAELKPWRPAVVFLFGLLHGLGFAGVLMELGMPAEQAVPALAAFNIGVEFGQLAVVGLAYLAVGWYRKNGAYRRHVVVPASLGIAAMGVYWMVERALF